LNTTRNKIFASPAGVGILVVVVVVVVVTASFWAFREIETAAEARKHTYLVIDRANVLLSELKDAETGQRGYALTGNEAFLEPYLAVRDKVDGNLKQLRKLVSDSAAQKHLDAIAPLVDATLAELATVIDLRRHHDLPAVIAAVSNGEGKRLMDSIRVEMKGFIKLKEGILAQDEAKLQSNLLLLFSVIVAATVFTLLFALWFAYLIYHQTQQRLKNIVHLETQHLLEIQEETNQQLQQANVALAESQERLLVTLNSIGDAVIATDAEGRVTLLNPLSERLTGWTLAEANGQPVEEILHIINQDTRVAIAVPIKKALLTGEIQSMTNHTVLIARGGGECIIADSCAPIRNYIGDVVGAVLVFRDVSKDYAAKQLLRDNATRIQTILNTMVDAIITFYAHNGLVETVNPAAEKMFGYPAAELIGIHFNTLVSDLDKDRRKDNLNILADYSADGEVPITDQGREALGWHKDGNPFPLDISVSEMRLGSQRYFTCILRDITQRKQYEAEQKKLDQHSQIALDAGRMGDWSWDAATNQVFLGARAAQIYGLPADISVTWEQMQELLSTEDAEVAHTAWEKALVEHTPYSNECRVNRTVGGQCWVAMTGRGIYAEDGTVMGMTGVMQDITERKLIESKLHEAIAFAEKANLAKSDFLSSMSHELRTPLNAILGFAQLLEAGNPLPTSAQKLRIGQIIKAGWYLLELINEILDLALIESGKLSLSRESVSLIDVLHECQAMMEPQAQQHGIKLSFLPFDDSWFVYADRTRLKQVMINLLSNAIKYNREHGTITVNCSANTLGFLRISIKDSGLGLSSDQLAQLFQPFNRLGQEFGIEEGTGIGLVVTKQLVELMGGKIGMASAVGVGSEFWIELIQRAAQQPTSKNAMPTKRTPQAQGNAALYTLLYVEDNPANLLLVEQIIEDRQGMCMLSAVDGRRGIALARTQRPDVILMDINLPGISGMDALKILRHDPATAHIPVIALSANAMPRDIEKGLKAGFIRYLTKPIVIDEFMDALDEVLKPSELELTKTNETGQLP
jgi:PAS domain S-box-containing protein